jgi:hypothetical protein
MDRAVIFRDEYGRPDQNPIAGVWTAGYKDSVGATIPGPQIVSGQVRSASTTSDNFAIVTSVLPNPDQAAQVTIATLGAGVSEIAIALRAGAPPTWTTYLFLAAKGEAVSSRIVYINAGNATDLVTDNSVTWAATDVLLGEAERQTLRLYRNGALVCSVTDTALASGSIGLDVYNDTAVANCTVDSYVGYSLTVDATAARRRGARRVAPYDPGAPEIRFLRRR